MMPRLITFQRTWKAALHFGSEAGHAGLPRTKPFLPTPLQPRRTNPNPINMLNPIHFAFSIQSERNANLKAKSSIVPETIDKFSELM